ncbi:MAG: endolytic transglycosylase MltG [Clostridia bacterium]
MSDTPNIYRAKSKQKRKKPIKKVIISIIIIFVILIISFGGFIGYNLLNDVYGFKNYNVTAEIDIPSGANTITISNLLLDAKVIKYPKLFRYFSEKQDANGTYKPGKHTLTTPKGYKEIIAALQKQGEDSFSMTFPEGYTQKDIINRFVKFNFGTYDEILKEMNEIDTSKYDFLQNLPNESKRTFKLEGYIFPDTYTDIAPKDTVTDVINRALSNMESKLEKGKIKDLAKECNLTLDEAITLSTIIQREVSNSKTPDSSGTTNMQKVSAVFHNRLNKKMKLQSDVTVAYALDGKKAINIADTKTESPYNTYFVDALPIGPICNPGIDALVAAVTPDKNYMDEGYLYFYSRPTGEVYFTKTYEEHKEVIKKYSHEWKDINEKNSK